MGMIVKTSTWSYGAAVWLADACNEFLSLKDLEKAVNKGNASLFDIIKDDKHCGSFVVSVDNSASCKEIVVLAAGGDMPGDSAYKVMTCFIEALAAQQGIKYIRGHTENAAVGRMMEAAGFSLSELVYRKEVKHG